MGPSLPKEIVSSDINVNSLLFFCNILSVTYTWFPGVMFEVMRCTRKDRPAQTAPPEGSPSGATMAFVVSEFL